MSKQCGLCEFHQTSWYQLLDAVRLVKRAQDAMEAATGDVEREVRRIQHQDALRALWVEVGAE